MECSVSANPADCEYAIEYAVLTAALYEAEELRVALNAEADSLRIRIQQLESYILGVDMSIPSEEH